MRNLRTSLLIALPVIAILALAACGTSGTIGASTANGGTSTTSGGTATSAATKPPLSNLSDYCNLVSLADVSQATGLTITQMTPIANQARQEVLCGYVADAHASTGAVVTFFVSSDSGAAQTIYNTLKQQAQGRGATVADVSGIGDMAFSAMQNGVDSVEVLKDSVVFATSGTTPHPLPLNVDTALARLIVSKL